VTLPQHIVYGTGGTLSLSVPALPTAATVTIETDTGAAVVTDESATVSSVATTLSAAAEAGATAVSLTSATGVSAGLVFRLSDAENARVKSVSGTTATLWRPLLGDHAGGADATGTLITYAVSAEDAGTLFFDGRAIWTLDSASKQVTACECTKYLLSRDAACDTAALFDELPALNDIIDGRTDPEKLLDEAHSEVLERIGGKHRVRVYTGSDCFKRATTFAACVRIFRPRAGESARELYERYSEELTRAIEELQGYAPRDTDQDGVVEERERVSMKSGRIYRA
jgi:hypothetical protein